MYTYKIGISAQEHDDFVKASSQTNLLQSASWAKVKDNWDNERIGFYKNDQLVASASILIKPLPLGMTMLYIPRGPIMDYHDQELLQFVLNSLKQFAKTKKALFIKFDPSLFIVQAQIGEDRKEQQETLDVIQNLQKARAIWVGRTESLDETIQPRFQANIYKDNFSEELLSKSTRQAIRTARNKGIQVQFGSKELLDDFSALMKKTENRKSIHLRGQDYYQKLLDTYPEHSYITLASIDLNERLESLQAQKVKAEKEASKFTEKTKPGKIENKKQEFLLEQRPETGLLANMWLFPIEEISKKQFQQLQKLAQPVETEKQLTLELEPVTEPLVAEEPVNFFTDYETVVWQKRALGEVVHIFSHLKWHILVFYGRNTGELATLESQRWVAAQQFSDYVFPKPQQKMVELFKKEHEKK